MKSWQTLKTQLPLLVLPSLLPVLILCSAAGSRFCSSSSSSSSKRHGAVAQLLTASRLCCGRGHLLEQQQGRLL
jgi:hypothetical protein